MGAGRRIWLPLAVSALICIDGLAAGQRPLVPVQEVQAAPSGSTNAATAPPKPAPKIGELPERRTRTSKTNRGADGKLTTSIFTRSINYKDGKGAWQPIDSTLVASTVAGYSWTNSANRFHTLFKKSLDSDYLRLDLEGRSYGLRLTGATSKPVQVTKSHAVYQGVLPGTDLRYDVGADGVKETLTLANAGAPASYQFVLDTPANAGAVPNAREPGSWEFRLPGEVRPVFILTRPFVQEAGIGKSVAAPVQSPVSMAVRQLGPGKFAVDLSLDTAWLQAPGRHFPVVVDPTFEIQPDTFDRSFFACPGCGGFGGQYLYAGSDTNGVYRSALQFDLSGIPVGATVTGGTLGVTNGYFIATPNPAPSHEIDAHRVTTPWDTSSSMPNFDPTVLSSDTIGNQQPRPMSWDVSSAVLAWVAGTQPNYGILLKRNPEPLGAGGTASWSNSYPDDPTKTPRLDIVYTTDAPWLYPPDTLHSNGGDLKWTRYAPASGAPFQKYEVHRSATPKFTPSATTLLMSSTDIATTTFRDTTAAPNQTYYYKVLANSSQSQEAKVTLPPDGQATKILQPSPDTGKDTFIYWDASVVNCLNYGSDRLIWVGTNAGQLFRGLLNFDLQDMPSNVSITSATLRFYLQYGPTQPGTISVHRMTRQWSAGTGGCNKDANWYQAATGMPWSTAGGDFDPASSGTLSFPASPPTAHEYQIASLVQQWVSGQAPNLGLMLKYDDETLVDGKTAIYGASNDTESPANRPKLSINYVDGSHSIAPTVSVAAPAAGSTVRGSVAVNAAASDDRRVDKVELYVDGSSSPTGTVTQAPYSFTWNTSGLSNGAHSLVAKAYDDAGNSTTSSLVTVTVANYAAPSTAITSPANNASGLQGTVQVATSNSVASSLSVNKVELYVDGALYGTPATAAPYSFSWNTLDAVQPAYDGVHNLTTKVFDSSGLVSTSAPVSVTTANTASSEYAASFSTSPVPQAVSFDPAAGTQLSYPVNVTVTNNSRQAWNSSSTFLHYRWYSQRPGDPVIDSGDLAPLGLNPGASTTVQVPVAPPALPDGVNAAQYRLRFDVVDTAACPSGWSCADVGQPTPGGTQSLSGSTWTVQGGGGDIWGTSDQFHFVTQSMLLGGGTVSARVVSQTNTDPWAKAGVMVRQGGDGGSAYYAVEVTPGNGVVVQYRVSSGAAAVWASTVAGTAPAYVRVGRLDSAFSAYTSGDGVTWTLVPGSTVTLNVSGGMMAGLAVTSHNTSALSTATFENVAFTWLAQGVPSTCPASWTCQDVGSPTPAGGQTVSGGTWTVQGGGADIWGTSDQFHLDSQVLAGDGTVSAHVTSQTNSDPWAKAGVMLRETADPASAYYAIEVTPGNGIVVQYRSATGATASWPATVAGTAPAYVRVVRSGNTFTAYTSGDGVSWTQVANSSVTLGIGGAMLAGLAVTSHNTSALSTATFDGVSVATTAPPGWSGADVGAATPAGSQSLSSGTWTVKGGGADIWGTSDQFRFVRQSLAGDGTVSAHVTSQTNSDPWAKAGVMLRQTADPGSAYYALEVTPGNGIVVQYRSPAGASAAWPASVAGTAPAYLRIARSNNTFNAYTSADGVSWTPVPGSSVTLSVSGAMLAGLAVTSHNTSLLSTATFDGVSVVTAVPAQRTTSAFADRGNLPLDNPVIVNKVLKTKLGLEHFYQYTSTPVGAGMANMVNVANGNSLLTLTPLSEPGRGLSTVARLTYNSLEKHSESPVGNNWSLSISSLTRFGNPIDIHPNNADTIAGRSNKFIEFVDGDGTLQHFDGVTGADGVTFWKEPPGVHLYLRSITTNAADPKYWAITRPDRVTFYFNKDGYPTFVSDKNGNTNAFTLTAVEPGDDPGGPKFHVTKVTDAAGQGANPAPNRSFNLTYFTKATAKKPQIRGKIASITDHLGHEIDFAYYDDGNLLSITELGGSNADGTPLASRSWIFTYTTSDGSGPVIPDPAQRVNPDPKQPNQSTRIYSVRDPMGQETLFTYNGPGSSLDRWKLASVQDRAGNTTSFSYDNTNLVTTVAAPTPAGQTARTTRYTYDTDGKPTLITDPLGQPTQLQWSADFAVTRLTEPNTNFLQFTYNDNGYLTDRFDQLGNHTVLTYQNVAADANDTSAHWRPGRTIPHLSQLATRQDPKEVAAGSPNKWTFAYDGNGNLLQVTEPLFTGNPAVNTYNADGTLATTTDFNGNRTTFASYDANGLPSKVVDAADNPAAPTHPIQFGYDSGGRLLFVQDANHGSLTGGIPAQYQTQFFYDSFNRLGRQSTPKLTGLTDLVWADTAYDANNNVVRQVAPHYEVQDTGVGDTTSASYDVMDRPTLVTGPDTSADPAGERTRYQYDVAGRLTQVTLPLGVQNGTPNNTHTVNYAYDGLDRVLVQTLNHDTGSGIQALNTLPCYDLGGNLVSVTAPKAGLSSISCPGTTATPFTTVYGYDADHRLTSVTNPQTQDLQNHQTLFAYDQNSNRTQVTDANGKATLFSYDALNRLIQVEQPFVSGHPVISRTQYDANGNVTLQISPRAYDAAPAPKLSFANYVTGFHYDQLNRMVRQDLPVGPSAPNNVPYYVHRAYDANGNLLSSSLPVSSSDPGQVDPSSKTQLSYFDPGWIESSQDPGGPRVHFDYTAKGEQNKRTPEDTGGSPDLSKQINWSYYADGMLQERRDQQRQPITYRYDADNQLVFSHDASGLTTPLLETFVDTQNSYDDLGRLVRSDLRKPKPGVNINWTFSSFAYDLNGNVSDQVQNGEEQNGPNDLPNGVVVKAGRSLHNDYDQANWLTTQLDFGTDPGAADDQRIRNSFTPLGLESRREIDKSNGAGDWTAKQVSGWDYFDNGKLNHLNTTGAGGASLESHTVSYLDSGGIYNNGNRTQDVFSLKPGNATSGSCYPNTCTASYVYDPRDRLVRSDDGRGTRLDYELDPSGNIKTEKRNDVLSKTYNYVGGRLDTIVAGTLTQKYNYDPFGRLHCVTTADGTEGDCSALPTGSPKLVQDYEYDYLDRLVGYGTFNNGTRTDHAVYTYDALNRLAGEVEEHPNFNTRITQFSYLGLGGQLTQEQQTDSSGGLGTKDYTYDAFGHRLSQTVSGSTLSSVPNGTSTYGYDVHGSVSQLVDSDGNSRASYGYLPYGKMDSSLSQGDPDPLHPINSFRYSAKRSDTGSDTMDMGVRRFGPDTSRFLTPDLFYGALANLSLSIDPLTQNRYGLAGGNPLGFREWDGHELVKDGGGGAATEPAPKQDKQEIPCRPSLDNVSEYEQCRPPTRPIPNAVTYEPQDKTDREATNRICGPSLGFGGRLLAQPLCLDFSAFARGKGGKGDGGGIRGRVLALLGLGEVGGGAAGSAVKQVAEKAGEKEATAAEETAASRAGNIVYRGGPDTPRNLTPRHPADTVDTDQPGLSTYRTPEQAMGETSKKAQVIDLNRLTNLKWVEDAAGHVSILPKTAEQLLEWASTRGTETVHPYTREVFEAIIGVVRR